VYKFLREAENRQFQEAQMQFVRDWINDVLGRTINGRAIRAYINSEVSVALYADMTVNIGRSDTTDGSIARGRNAIRSVFGRRGPSIAENQKQTLENNLIAELQEQRKSSGMSHPVPRAALIESRLSSVVDSFKRET
jgi:hypothetical protein